jgi:hypothetical protein
MGLVSPRLEVETRLFKSPEDLGDFLQSDIIFESSQHSIFQSSRFQSIYAQKNNLDILQISISDEAHNMFAGIHFNVHRLETGKIRFVSSSFSPYAGLFTNSKETKFIIQSYNLMVEALRSFSGNAEFYVEIRMPPQVFLSDYPIHEWALWSLGFQKELGYLGRYVDPTESTLRKYRKQKLLKAQVTISKFEIERTNRIEDSVYRLVKENRQQRYGVSLTHSMTDLHDLSLLRNQSFLDIWKLKHENHLCVVAIIFSDFHEDILQYLAQAECGYTSGSQDVMLNQIILQMAKNRRKFILGTSTEPEMQHRSLNYGLDAYKATWGALPYSCFRFVLKGSPQ